MGELGEELIDLGWTAGSLQFRLVGLAADFADTNEWAAAGYATAGRWIADQLDVALRTANSWIHTGRALRGLPRIADAMANRELSYSKVRTLVGIATPDNEAELVALAQRHTAGELPRAVAAWSQRHEDDDVIDARRRAARGLDWQTLADGTVLFTARLTPEQAAVVRAAIDSELLRQHPTDGTDPARLPSLRQQRSDALVNLISGGGTNVTTEVVLHVRGDGCSLDDGSPVTENAVLRMLPNSYLRALIHDAERRPINASARRRHPNDRQKRVVRERDRACVDCGSTALLEFDHQPPFAETGHTIVDELVLRCSVCHRHRHRDQSAA